MPSTEKNSMAFSLIFMIKSCSRTSIGLLQTIYQLKDTRTISQSTNAYDVKA